MSTPLYNNSSSVNLTVNSFYIRDEQDIRAPGR